MRRITRILAMCLLLTSCGNEKNINGVRYGTFGLANESDMRNPNIRYEVSLGSVFVGILLSETLIVPIYVILFDLYQPVGPMNNNRIKGEV